MQYKTLIYLFICSFLYISYPSLANDPAYDEVTILERIKEMDVQTVKPRYTSVVKGYLKGYTVWNREKSSRIMGRSVMYFPLFEEYLEKYDLPDDLKYLSVVESALQAKAESRVGAIGLWQFMPVTANEMNLKINKYIDERQDPHKSTDAAMRYLKRQYKRFGSWELALAAYNGGSGRVSRAIKRGRSKNFWTIKRYLPKETRDYIPAYIAACYLGRYYDEHGIMPQYPDLDLQLTETITIYNYLTFIQLQELTGLSLEEIELLNPAYIRNFIPSNVLGNTLTLPKRVMPVVKEFLKGDPELSEKGDLSDRIQQLAIHIPNKEDFYHKGVYRVAPNETLSQLALSFNLSVHHLMAWNQLAAPVELQEGQELLVYGLQQIQEPEAIPVKIPVAELDELPSKPIDTLEAEVLPPNTFRRENYLCYTVKPKESLTAIAAQFEGVTVTDIMILNNFRGTQIPKAGREIRIKKLDIYNTSVIEMNKSRGKD